MLFRTRPQSTAAVHWVQELVTSNTVHIWYNVCTVWPMANFKYLCASLVNVCGIPVQQNDQADQFALFEWCSKQNKIHYWLNQSSCVVGKRKFCFDLHIHLFVELQYLYLTGGEDKKENNTWVEVGYMTQFVLELGY